MTKASNAEQNASAAFGGPASRRAGSGGARPAEPEIVPPAGRKSSFTLWLWVAGAFLLLVIAWTIMFTAARSAKIQSVPLTTSGGKAR